MEKEKTQKRKTIGIIIALIIVIVILLLSMKSCTKQEEPAKKADPIVTAPVALENISYNGSEQVLIDLGSTTGGTIQYALGNENGPIDSYSEALPVGMNAGQYYVWYKVVGDDNFNDVKEQVVSVTIKKRVVKLISQSNLKIYDGKPLTAKKITIGGEGFVQGEGVEYAFTGSQTKPGTSVNTFTYKFNDLTKEANYEITKVEGELTVRKIQTTFNKPSAIDSLVYNTTNQSLIVAGSSSFGTIQYSLDNVNFSTELPQATNAGEYVVYYKVEGDEFHEGVKTGSIKVNISKADSTMSAPTQPTLEVDGACPSEILLRSKVVLQAITPIDGSIEYAVNTTNVAPTEGWQSSTSFNDLDPITQYYFFARYVGDGNYYPSLSSTGLAITTTKANQAAPASPVIESLEYNNENNRYEVTLKEISQVGTGKVLYACATTSDATDFTWYVSRVFGVEADDSSVLYYYACYEGNEKYNQSPASQPSSALEGYKSCCFAAGTDIAMGDGSTKKIENIKVNDEVLTYNHEAGKYETQKVCIVFKGKVPVVPFTLHFSDGSEVSITNTHYLFVKEELKYAAISKDNAQSYIGKHFYSCYKNDYIELVDVTYQEDVVDFYTIYTEYNFNYFANGLLNISDDIAEYLNFYTFKEDLSVDLDVLNEDIHTYGLFEYSSDLSINFEEFEVWHGKYANIIIGKGLLTWEDIENRHSEYVEYYRN